jgi:hypothetical protein
MKGPPADVESTICGSPSPARINNSSTGNYVARAAICSSPSCPFDISINGFRSAGQANYDKDFR